MTVEPTATALAELFPRTTWIVAIFGIGVTLALATAAHQMQLRRCEHAAVEQLQ